ncbi:MAG: CHASE domain-containing protein [Gammaproteobacteria bacterium]|nr:PAS domain S-box protein [Sideroxydans sp.]MBU3902978.1 CHASE domain-containing protein [Gammaproteobacteria bacterium]MBU4045916.1 CHASE domain-containing protein [Gammaproteobacteria bacterium]MBU4150238.1 CHASE domain-containing protein [Gammaproteobacteria bacterium]
MAQNASYTSQSVEQALGMRFVSKHASMAWLLLLVGLMATSYAVYVAKSDIEQSAMRDFAAEAEEVRLKVEARLQAHKQVLLGGAAMFDASDFVSREEWRVYAKRVRIDEHFNGIQGLGYAQVILPAQLPAHVAAVRKQGFPQYSLYPSGQRELYTTILYLEPFQGRNLRAFGYDMYSDPVRRAAMAQARDDHTVALSGKVTLVQETDRDVQAGTLMYAPVYRNGALLDTVQQRRAALRGWVYSPFRMNDLLDGVLARWDDHTIQHIHMQVYDGAAVDPAALLYDSRPGLSNPQPLFGVVQHIDFSGRVWTLNFEQHGGDLTGLDYSKAWGYMWFGLGMSLLMFFLALSWFNTRRNAALIAAELTAALRIKDLSLNAAANAVLITDRDGRIEWANHAFETLSGYGVDEAVGRTPKELVRSGRQDQAFYDRMWQTIRAGRIWHGELVNRRQDGTLYDEEMTITPVSGEGGEITHFIAVKQDITARKQAEAQLRELNRDFVSFLENTTDFVYFKDRDSRFRFCSQTLAKITGHANWRNMIGKHDREVFPPDTAQIYIEEELPVFRTGKALLNKIAPYYDESGRKGWVLTNKWPLFDTDGKTVIGIFGVSRDVSAMVEAQNALRESENRFRTLADSVPVMIWIAGADKGCTYFNQVWLAFTGRQFEQELGDGWLDSVHEEDRLRCLDTYASAFEARQPFTMEYRLRRHDGEYRWIIDHGVPNHDAAGGFIGYIGSCLDISDRHEMETLIRQMAFYDVLTRLPNRRLLNDRLQQAMAASARSGRYGALMFLDLDNFKPLNDQHGHDMGDLLLAEVARRITACVRRTDTVARLGGDEFVVVLSELEGDRSSAMQQALLVAEKVRAALADPYLLQMRLPSGETREVEHFCTSSIGLLLFGANETGVDELLKQADTAMYHAKQAGRNRVYADE